MNRIFYMAMLLVTWLSFAPSYADDVARIGDVEYASLAEAVAAVPDNSETTIMMIGSEALNAGVTIAANKNIVLDLNGNVLSGILGQSGTTALITNRGTLTIKDSSVSGNGKITNTATNPDSGDSPGYASNTITNNGKLTIESGYIESATTGGYAAYTVDNQTNGNAYTPELTINGGKLYNKATDAVRMFLNSDTKLNKVVINGGVIDSDKSSGRVIVVQDANAKLNKGELDITGGEIQGVISAWSGTSDFTYSDAQYEAIEINITGGTIEKLDFADYMTNTELRAQSLKVTGGVYNESPDAYVTSGYVVVDNDDATYKFKVERQSVAQIGDVKYATLADAVAAVPTNGTATTIAMLDNEVFDAESKLTVATGKNIVLDLNGKTITGSSTTSSPNFYFITNKGTLEITDNSEGALGKITYGCSAATYSNEYVTICNEGGTFTLTNGTIENTSGGLSYAVNNRSVAQGIATFNLNGGTISAPSGDAAIRVYQSVYNASSSYDNIVNVTGGTILNSGIFVDSYIGNNVDGSNSHLNVNISGGTVNGLIDYKLRHPYNIALNITGGTFVDSKLWVRKHSEWKNVVAEPTAPIVHISGGKFSFANNKAFGLAYDCGATSWTSYTQPYDVSDGVFNVNLNNFSGIAFPEGKTGVANTDSETSEAYPYTVGVAPVAQIGETKYATLADAIADVPTDGTETTITMIADETIEGNTGVTVAANKNIVLNLNGHTVANQVNVNNTSWVIDNKGTLTVKDSSEGGNGKLKNALADGVTGGQWSNYNYSTSVINNKGTLNIQSGTLEQTAIGNISYTIDSTGEINITGGTISSANGAGIRMLCNSTSSTSSINMTAGTINAKWGVYIQNPNSNVPNNNGSMTVTGGTINAEKDCIFVDADTNWTSGLNATLSNGTFIAGRSAIHMDGSKTLSGLYITGGNYTTAGDEAATAVISTGTGNSTLGVISGGLFNVSPNAAYIADGYVAVANTDSETSEAYPFTVVPISYVAKIGDNDKYTTLAAAIAAVADGEEIKMIANSNENVLYDVTSPNLKNKTVTISGAYTLTSPDGSFGFYFGDYDNGNRPTTDKLNVSGITMAKSGGNYTTLFDGVTADLTNVTVNGDGNTALSYANGAVGTLTNVTVTNTGSHTQTWRNTALALQGIGSGTSEVTVKSGSYTSVNGYAVYMFSSGGTLNIEGGTFSGALMSQIDNNRYPDNQSIINISGGTFANCTLTESGGENAQIYVSGGTFSINPTAYVLPGYAAVETVIDNTTWWKVGKVVTGDMTKQDGATATQATYTVVTQVVDGNEVLSTTTNTTVTVAIAGENNVAVDAELDDLKMDNVVSKSVKEVPGNDINVEIAVVATAETPAVENTLVFEVHPEATVYVSNVKQGTVELENSDLATGATFTFKLPVAGTFENGTEVKVVHKSSDPATYPDETFYATVSDGKVTITVSHFSDFELSAVQQFSELDVELVDGTSYEECVGRPVTQDVVVRSVKYKRYVPNANTYCAWYVPAAYRLTSADLDQFDFYRINLIANAEGGNEVENTSRIWVYLFPMAADDVLTANRPYVFKTKGGTGQFTFTLENTLHAPATDVRLNNSTTAHNYDFYGTYETTELSDNSSEHFFYVDYYGQMGYPGDYYTTIPVGPYRWFIKTTQKGGGAYYAPTFVFTDDSNVTGITDNLEVKTIDCYYDLKGMKIEKPSKGAYLVKFKDGTVKKVVK